MCHFSTFPLPRSSSCSFPSTRRGEGTNRYQRARHLVPVIVEFWIAIKRSDPPPLEVIPLSVEPANSSAVYGGTRCALFLPAQARQRNVSRVYKYQPRLFLLKRKLQLWATWSFLDFEFFRLSTRRDATRIRKGFDCETWSLFSLLFGGR